MQCFILEHIFIYIYVYIKALAQFSRQFPLRSLLVLCPALVGGFVAHGLAFYAFAFGVPAPKLPGLLGCRLIDPCIQFWDLYFVSGSAAPQSDLHFLYLQFTFTNFFWVCGTLVRYLCTLTIWYLQFCAGCFLVSVSALTVPPTGW